MCYKIVILIMKMITKEIKLKKVKFKYIPTIYGTSYSYKEILFIRYDISYQLPNYDNEF